ncbi:MAG: CoA-disulfide reductase [bacterium]
MKIVIIGGVAGGASTAARLRRLDENATIIMFERGEHVSFANCGIPYYCSDVISDREKLLVSTPKMFEELMNIEARTFSEVISINKDKKIVTIKDLKTNIEYEETYDKLVLSPGAFPVKPPIEGINDERIFTVRNLNDADKIKNYIKSNNSKLAVVIGAGFIGVEMAENLKHFGLDVSIVELSEQVMTPVDTEIASYIHNHLREHGINLYLGDGVKRFKSEGNLIVELNSNKEIQTDLVIFAIGVRPEVKLAKDAGLEIGQTGGIKVNEYMTTSDDEIYAVGDAVESTDAVMNNSALIPLAGPANRQGRICADNIAGIKHTYKGTLGSSIIKIFDLTIASTGNNEKSLKRNGINYKKVYIHGLSHASYYPKALPMMLKVLFSETDGKILGAQAVGYEGVDKRIDVISTAIKFNATINDLTELELTYAPPFNSAKDLVNLAGMAGQNVLADIYKPFYIEELASLSSGSLIIDVRSEMERTLGFIDDSRHIPLEEIRTKLNEIPKDKQIILYCSKGFKSYMAQRILQQNGYDNVYSLSGGYLLYREIKKDKNPPLIEAKSAENLPANDNTPVTVSLQIDACGMQCPGPIMKISSAIKNLQENETIEIKVTDQGFKSDIVSWCKSTGNNLIKVNSEAGIISAIVQKKTVNNKENELMHSKDSKTLVVFSQDLDKALASFIIANGAAATGKKVTMFFTFWGLNVLRRPEAVKTQKGLIDRMFGLMMPRGTENLTLSKMNMMGLGSIMMRWVMKNKNVQTLQELIEQAKQNGVELIACQMSLDVMGLKQEELIDGVTIGGVANYIEKAENSDVNLFI